MRSPIVWQTWQALFWLLRFFCKLSKSLSGHNVCMCVCVCVCKSSSVRNNSVLRMGRQAEEEEKECAAKARIYGRLRRIPLPLPLPPSVCPLPGLFASRARLIHTRRHTHTRTHSHTHAHIRLLFTLPKKRKSQNKVCQICAYKWRARHPYFSIFCCLFSQKMNETQHTFPLFVISFFFVEMN